MSAPGDDDPLTDGDSSERRGGDPRPNGGASRANDESSSPSLFHEFRTAESGGLMILREMLTSAGAVLMVGLILFTVSGVWPPMVAVESGSMNPNLERGDLVFIVDEHRFSADGAHEGTGVVPYRTAEKTGYRSIGDYGDVIIYQADGEAGTPIIHRARFWVDEGENWYDKADQQYIRADSCSELANCPAPNAGFITKGDNQQTNDYYDQVSGISKPVRPEWITGSAKFHIPELGRVRLFFAELALVSSGSGPVGALPVAFAS